MKENVLNANKVDECKNIKWKWNGNEKGKEET